jgi:hypothetical protein
MMKKQKSPTRRVVMATTSMFSPGYHERKLGMNAPWVPPANHGILVANTLPTLAKT